MTTLLDMLPSLLLIAGGCALAVWAKGLKDEQSAVVSRLTEPKPAREPAKPSQTEPPPSDAGAGNSG